ncbi:riboflavin kinase [Hyaloscypha variabilis]
MAERPQIIGPDSGPEPPFPLRMGGQVVSGFGRGSKELGIPTANIPVEGISWIETAESGVYFGWAGIQLPPSHPDLTNANHASTAPSINPTTANPSPQSTVYPSAPSPPPSALENGWRLYPMVMSIGYNPFYNNPVRSAEVHVLHKFEKDFYGCEMRVSILGFIRRELDYVSVEALIGDIETDCRVAGASLEREAWRRVAESGGEGEWLWGEEA